MSRKPWKYFCHRKEEFDSQIALLKTFNLPKTYVSKTKAQLAAVILRANRINRSDEFDLILPDTLRIKKYRRVVDWYQDTNNHNYDNSLETTVGAYPISLPGAGCTGQGSAPG